MSIDFNTTSRMSQLLKLSKCMPLGMSQRQRSFLGFAYKASNNISVCYKMNNEGK